MNAQEQFWKGDFGDQYTERNRVEWSLRVPFWRSILRQTDPFTVFEVGCNAGWNLMAIREIDPSLCLWGCDINERAAREAKEAGFCVDCSDVFSTAPYWQADLVFTAGVLIHVGPEQLEATMRRIVQASSKWVLAVEYEAKQEEVVEYRGNAERLWKRPFGDLYQAMGLTLVAVSDAQGFDKCTAWLLHK